MATLILKTSGLQSQWCLLTCNELLIRIVHKNNDKNAKLFLRNYHLKQWKTSCFGAVSDKAKDRRIQPFIPKCMRNLPQEGNDPELVISCYHRAKGLPSCSNMSLPDFPLMGSLSKCHSPSFVEKFHFNNVLLLSFLNIQLSFHSYPGLRHNTPAAF